MLMGFPINRFCGLALLRCRFPRVPDNVKVVPALVQDLKRSGCSRYNYLEVQYIYKRILR